MYLIIIIYYVIPLHNDWLLFKIERKLVFHCYLFILAKNFNAYDIIPNKKEQIINH